MYRILREYLLRIAICGVRDGCLGGSSEQASSYQPRLLKVFENAILMILLPERYMCCQRSSITTEEHQSRQCYLDATYTSAVCHTSGLISPDTIWVHRLQTIHCHRGIIETPLFQFSSWWIQVSVESGQNLGRFFPVRRLNATQDLAYRNALAQQQ